MTKEQTLLLNIIKTSVTDESISDVDADINWKELANEAYAQAVALLVFDQTSSIKDKIPKDIYDKWFKFSLGLMSKYSRISNSQKELVGLLEKEALPYCIIKGESSAVYYPNPSLRTLGDVDFLIDPNHKNKIKELLIKNGFEASHEHHPCHVVFTKPDSHLEMHFEVAGIPEGEVGEKIRGFIKEAVNNTVIKDVGNGSFRVAESKYHALILLLHMQHHMLGEGIGLRHLLDWGNFVNKTADDSFWNDELIPFLKDIGLYNYMCVMTCLCNKYFGTAKPKWCGTVDDDICSEIIEDILKGGNFGKKDKLRGRISDNVQRKNRSKADRIRKAYRTLKASTKDIYPIVEKYKILCPFVYLYRIVRYLVLVGFGKKASVFNASADDKKRISIYNKLHIFEVTENE